MLILFPQTWILLIRKLCCLCLKTTNQWSRWSRKGRSPTMRHVSRTPRSCSWLVVDRFNLDKNLFEYRLPSVKKIDYSSSSWFSTLKRRWSLRNQFENSQYWSDDMWKSKTAGGGGNKKRFQYCTDPSGQEILYLWALQSHSGRNPIDFALQDNVLIPDNFEYSYHIGCAVSIHSITTSGLIAGGQNSSKDRQTVFFTACESHE